MQAPRRWAGVTACGAAMAAVAAWMAFLPAPGGAVAPQAMAASAQAAPVQAAPAQAQAQGRAQAVQAPNAQAAANPPVAAKYPSPELVAACEKVAAAVRAADGVKMRTVVYPPFVVAGDMGEGQLDSYARGSVVRPAKALWNGYFDRRPDKAITVYLFGGAKNYAAFAKRDYSDGGEPHFGYYVDSERRMVMNIDTGTGTLVHELTHALIVYDFPDLPTWFNEGFASLHEQCQVGEDTITGLTNWRLPDLQVAIKAGTLRSLKDLVTERDFYGRKQGMNYAQARYFVMYMQTKGLLKDFYRYFRAHHSGQGADVKAIEHVFDQKLPEVEKAFLAWVRTLRF
jgi:hypothetical protein